VPRHVLEALDLRAKRRCLPAVERAWAGLWRPAAAVRGHPHRRDPRRGRRDVRLSARKGELHLVGKGEKSRTVLAHPKLG
jgi:hypothetical protein